MFWFFGPEACGILAPRPGIKPAPPALEGEVLTTGLPGKSQGQLIFKKPKMEWSPHLTTCVFSTPSFPKQNLSREMRLDRIAQLDHFGKWKIEDNWNSFFWFMLLAEKLCFLKVTLL